MNQAANEDPNSARPVFTKGDSLPLLFQICCTLGLLVIMGLEAPSYQAGFFGWLGILIVWFRGGFYAAQIVAVASAFVGSIILLFTAGALALVGLVMAVLFVCAFKFSVRHDRLVTTNDPKAYLYSIGGWASWSLQAALVTAVLLMEGRDETDGLAFLICFVAFIAASGSLIRAYSLKRPQLTYNVDVLRLLGYHYSAVDSPQQEEISQDSKTVEETER